MKKNTAWSIFLFFLTAAAILGFSSIPFWLGKSAETDTLVFRGTYTDTQDYAVHISMMQAGRQGDWAYQFRFTSEEHNPAFIRLFYIFLGRISYWTGLDVEMVFHIARWIFGLTALFAIAKLFTRIFPDNASARFAFSMTVLGAGIGWLQLILGAPLEPISPIDLWLIDAYILFSISLFPSFSFMLTLMAGGVYLFLGFLENGRWQNIAWLSLFAILGQFINPIAYAVVDAAMLGAVLFTWWKQHKIEPKHGYALIIIALSQIPLLVYNLIILTGDPIWGQFTRQNETLSPPPIFYFWGFFPFWLFALMGMVKAIRNRDPVFGALSFWVISGFALAYLPVPIQRRFLLGITIPLGALAIYGIHSIFNKLPEAFLFLKKREYLFLFTFVLLASISSIFLVINSSLYVMSRPAALFYTRDLETAAEWLNKTAEPDDFILANIYTSQILAQRTSLKVYAGHEMETLYYHNKESMMRAYFKGIIGNEWLSQTPIRWVIVGPYEVEINPNFSPDPYLELMYQNEFVKIYKVKP